MRVFPFARLVLAPVLLTACTVEIDSYKPVEVKQARPLDILFVLDDSSDRARYDQMAAQLDVLQAKLAEIDGQLPSLHVGVVTTDLGTDSTQDFPVPSVANCAGYGKAARLQTFDAGIITDEDFLKDLRSPDGTRTRNYGSGDLGRELAALTNPAGDTASAGCEFEQPLEAMRRALDPSTNPGFVRPDAMLSVVFLTNEDDCSLARGAMLDPWTQGSALGPLTSFRCTEFGVRCDFPTGPRAPGEHQNCHPREDSPYLVAVSEYEAFLANLKPARDDVVVSAVAGPRTPFTVGDIGQAVLNPSCQGASGMAYPAVRIGSLVDSFGGTLIDSCNQAAAYERIAGPIVDAQRTCAPALLADESEDCRVMEIAGETEVELPRCAGGSDASTCWYSYADPQACPDGANLGIAIKRGTEPAPPSSRIEARCFVK